MTSLVTPKILAKILSKADLSVLPTSNPGNGKPWIDLSGLVRSGAGVNGTIPYIPSVSPADGVAVAFDGLGGLKALGYTPANDSNVLHTTGNETKTGDLNLNGRLILNDQQLRLRASNDSNWRVNFGTVLNPPGGLELWGNVYLATPNLGFGGSSSSHPLIKRLGATSTIQFRNGTDTANAAITALSLQTNGVIKSEWTGGANYFAALDASTGSVAGVNVGGYTRFTVSINDTPKFYIDNAGDNYLVGNLQVTGSRITGPVSTCFIELYNPSTGQLVLEGNSAQASPYGDIVLRTGAVDRLRVTATGTVNFSNDVIAVGTIRSNNQLSVTSDNFGLATTDNTLIVKTYDGLQVSFGNGIGIPLNIDNNGVVKFTKKAQFIAAGGGTGYTTLNSGIDLNDVSPGTTGIQYWANNLTFWTNNIARFNISSSKDIRIPSDHVYAWASDTINHTAGDTFLKRVSAGNVGVYQSDNTTPGTLTANKVAASTFTGPVGSDTCSLYFNNSNGVVLRYSSNDKIGVVQDSVWVGQTTAIHWGLNTNILSGVGDVMLKRPTTNTLGVFQGDGTTRGSFQAGIIDSVTTGHTDTFALPGNATPQLKLTNDTSSFGIHHHYYPAQGIDRWAFRVTPNGITPTASKHLTIGYLYDQPLVETDMNMFYVTSSMYLNQTSGKLNWQFTLPTQTMDWLSNAGGQSDLGMVIQPSTGFRVASSYNTVNLLHVNSTTTTIAPRVAANVALTVKGLASQTGNLTEWKNSSNTTLASISSSGTFKSIRESFGSFSNGVYIQGVNSNGYPDVELSEGLLAGYGGVISVRDGTSDGTKYARIEYNGGYPQFKTTQQTFGFYGSGFQVVMTNAYGSWSIGSIEYFRLDGTLNHRGNIQQSHSASSIANPSARFNLTAQGKRDLQVGDGDGNWQTGYREEYNSAGGGIKCAFFGGTPTIQPAGNIASGLVALGLFSSATLPISSLTGLGTGWDTALAATYSAGGGSVATDTIWDAAGDLVVGTGSNTASRLPIGTSLQVLRVNSGATGLEWATFSAGGDALVANPLSQFASTTSAQLAGVISDETGTGVLVFNNSPTLITPVLGKGSYTALLTTEVTLTPSGTTQTINLTDANHQTLDLTSTTGNTTITITVPSTSGAGTIIIKQHGTTVRDLTWSSSATIKWAGSQPTWLSDTTSSERIVSWRYNGSILYLSATDIFT